MFAFVTSLVLAATACGGGAEDTPGGTVRFLVFGAPEELAAYRSLAAAYERSATQRAADGGGAASAAPSARVELIEASDREDLIARLSTSIAGGAPPDVFLMNYRFYGQFAARGAIEPVDERLRASTVIRASDFYPTAMDAFRWQGRQLCLPTNVSSLAVYYNRDLFQRYEVPEPQPDWTWTDLTTTASALTRNAGGAIVRAAEPEGAAPGTAGQVAVYGLGIEPTVIRVAPLVWSNGGEVVDNDQRPTRFTFDTPQAREALRQFVDLRLGLGVVPSDEEVEAQDDESRFASGGLAMLLSSRRSTTTFREITGFEWDVAPLPRFGAEAAGILHSDAYCITRGSANKDAAWRFVEFAMSPEGQRALATTGRTVPSHIAVSRSPAFLDPSQPPRNAQVFLDAIGTVRRVPSISTWPEIEDIAGGILENALYRGDPLDQVIRDLDAQTRPLFARAQAP